MAIQFARARYISRKTGGSSVRSAAYNAREAITSERTGERFSFLPTARQGGGNALRSAAYNARATIAADNGEHFSFGHREAPEHHEILLPAGASPRFADAAVLWNAVEAAEKRKNSQLAREVVVALPADREITKADRIELVRTFATQHFVSKGLAVQIDLHVPHSAETEDETTNYHAHLLITTRRLEGDCLAAKKARDLDPQVRAIRGRPVVAEGELWGEAWRDHQNAYFGDHGLGITVDPIAAVPGEHLGPIRFRHPQSEKVKAAEIRREVNAEAARDPATVVDTLRRQQQRFDGRTLERFLAKHLTDPDERAAVKERVLEQERREKREALEKAAWADRVPSGWRAAQLEDIAHELSPEYAAMLKQAARLQSAVRKATKAIGHRERAVAEEEAYLQNRWGQMGVVRRVLHQSGALPDREMQQHEAGERKARRSLERMTLRRAALVGQLNVTERRAAAALEEIRPKVERVLAERQREAAEAREALAQSDGYRAAQKRTERRGARLSM